MLVPSQTVAPARSDPLELQTVRDAEEALIYKWIQEAAGVARV